ncbi:MAG: TolC family protein, partial [Lysobacter sp.]|nr:TolC family protein [Lysobacter sp.]
MSLMIRRRWVVCICAVLLEACTVPGTVPIGSAIEPPAGWLHGDGIAFSRRAWWRQFEDPVLDALVEEGLRGNLDLRQADDRIAEARELWRAESGSAWPTVSAGATMARSRQISEVSGRPYDSTGEQGVLQVSYELDLWGKIESMKGAAAASYEAARASRDAAELTIASTIASTYIALRASDARLALDRQTLESRQRSLAVNQARFRTGYGSSLEVAQAELEMRATALTIPQDMLATERLERALDVLLARPPGAIERGRPFDDLVEPPMPSAGLPSELLQRRPDIAVAEWQLLASDS